MWNLKCEGKVFSLSHDMRNKDAKKTIIVYSHDSEFSIPLQCNIINLKSFLQYVSTFVNVRCRQIKKLKKKLLELEFLNHKKNKIQKQPRKYAL